MDWISPEDNVPTIMFHGTSDLVVPYDYGLPFTINIALPIVYGSSQIYNKLNSVDIESEIYIEEGEGHEYWGTLNGAWVSGPNDYYYQIQDSSFNFLYNQLDVGEIGDINQDSDINVMDVVELVNIILGTNEANSFSDINQDNSVDILDVIQLVNIIIN